MLGAVSCGHCAGREPQRTPLKVFVGFIFFVLRDVELNQHAEFRLGNICADAVSNAPKAEGP
jgi:hypothetical protein